MSGVAIFVLVSTNEFITVKVFLRLFTVSTRFQNLTLFGDPNGHHFLNWAIDVCRVTVFVLISTNKFITVKVFFWLFTVSTRFQHFAFFGHPNRRHFLDRFFNRFVDVGSITVFILVGTNEFITVKVFLRLLTIHARFKNFTSYRYPNGGHFLDWFFNRFVDVGSH